MRKFTTYKFIIIAIFIGYTPSLKTTISNVNAQQPFISVYGVRETEGRIDDLSVQFQYGIPGSTLNSTTANGGTITNANSLAILATAGAAGASALLQSQTNLQYVSGHEADAYFTVAFAGAIASGSTQYIGIFDTANGFAVGFNGTSFGVLIRNNSVDTFIAQSSFNGDKLNGTGTSGFTYQAAKLNVFRIAYGWLGASIIKFQIMNTNGNWITFHTVQQPNSSATPSIANPMLPMSASVIDTSGGNLLSLQTASWNMGLVATESNVADRYFMISNQITIPNLTETLLLIIQNKTTFQSKPNKVNVQLSLYMGKTTTTATSTVLFRIYKNATVTGTSYTDVNTNASVTQYSTAGTYTANTGQMLYMLPVQNFSNSFVALPPLGVYNIILYPGDTLTLTAAALSGSVNVLGMLAWTELF